MQAQTPELTDDFESYDLGYIINQASHWRTWSSDGGTIEDGKVINTRAQSGSKSLLISNNGITDLILLTPSNPSTGFYTIQFSAYIPQGKSGYFTMQAALTPNNSPWNQALMGGSVYFNCDGNMGGQDGVTGVEQFSSYPLTFGGQVFIELAGLNFYSVNNTIEMYIDDVIMGAGNLAVNNFTRDIFSIYTNPVSDILNISSKTEVSNVVVYDILGKSVISATPNISNPQIDMSGLSTGVYMVKVSVGNSSKTFKIIK